MVQNALGLIETVGLAAAVEAADAAVKAANIKLIGYELTKGGGLVVVKLSGDVGAVKAAVQAGSIAAGKVNKVWATHVIPRPHEQISCILATKETIGLQEKKILALSGVLEVNEFDKELTETEEVGPEVHLGIDAEEIELSSEEAADEAREEMKESLIVELHKKPADYCNLCGDPACPRIKGDPKNTCIHYEKNHKEE